MIKSLRAAFFGKLFVLNIQPHQFSTLGFFSILPSRLPMWLFHFMNEKFHLNSQWQCQLKCVGKVTKRDFHLVKSCGKITFMNHKFHAFESFFSREILN